MLRAVRQHDLGGLSGVEVKGQPGSLTTYAKEIQRVGIHFGVKGKYGLTSGPISPRLSAQEAGLCDGCSLQLVWLPEDVFATASTDTTAAFWSLETGAAASSQQSMGIYGVPQVVDGLLEGIRKLNRQTYAFPKKTHCKSENDETVL